MGSLPAAIAASGANWTDFTGLANQPRPQTTVAQGDPPRLPSFPNSRLGVSRYSKALSHPTGKTDPESDPGSVPAPGDGAPSGSGLTGHWSW